jgi:hypothetical protein
MNFSRHLHPVKPSRAIDDNAHTAVGRSSDCCHGELKTTAQ